MHAPSAAPAVTSAQSQPVPLEAGPSRSANLPLPPRESFAPPPPGEPSPAPSRPESPLTTVRAESPDLNVIDNIDIPPAAPGLNKRGPRVTKSKGKGKGKETQADAEEDVVVCRTTRRRQGT